MQLVEVYRAKIIDVASFPGHRGGRARRSVQSLIVLLETFGILEIVRTGRVAMVRGPK